MDEKKQQKLKAEDIKSVEVGKAFHLFKRRNEWVNWSGDTSLVNRSNHAVKLSLFEAEQSAEKLRLQGTKFFIGELPIICIKSNSGALILTELFTDSPMRWYLSRKPSLNGIKSIGSLMDALPQQRWGVQSLHEGQVAITTPNGMYFSRKSSPGKGKNHMAWSLELRRIDDKGIEQFANDLPQLVSGAVA
jgi:hypothetical protein